MSPQEFISDLCRRYGVSEEFGRRLLPLAERAEEVRPEMRKRLHDFLVRSFLAQAAIEVEEGRENASWNPTPEERRLLEQVAGVLHEWTPPGWLDRWTRLRDDDSERESA